MIDLQRSQLKLSIITTRQRSGEGYMFSRVSGRPWEAGVGSCGAVHAPPDMFKLERTSLHRDPTCPGHVQKICSLCSPYCRKGGRLAFD